MSIVNKTKIWHVSAVLVTENRLLMKINLCVLVLNVQLRLISARIKCEV